MIDFWQRFFNDDGGGGGGGGGGYPPNQPQNPEGPDFPPAYPSGGNYPFDARDFGVPGTPDAFPFYIRDFPGNVSAGELGNVPSGIGPQVEFPGMNLSGPGSFNDQFSLPTNEPAFNWNDNQNFGYDLPPSPDFPFTNYFPPDNPNISVMEPTGNTGIYDPNTYTPFTDFNGGGGYNAPPDFSGGFDAPGEMQNPPGGSGVPGSFDFTAPPGIDVNPFLQEIPGNFVQDTSGGVGAAVSPSYANEGQGAFGGGAPGIPGNPLTINPSDPNNNLTRGGQSMPLYPTSQDVFPQPSLKDELGRPTDWAGAGQFVKDAAGNLVNAAGKIVATAAQIAGGIPGTISNMAGAIANNIMNDPGYSSPDYLRSMGYTPGAGTGSLWPGQASNTNFGAGGEGGSFFGGTMQLNPGGGDISGANNPFGAGQVGRSSVGPPQGGGGPPMYGPTSAAALWGRGNGQALHWLQQMRKGIFTTPQNFGLMKHAMPSPWASQPLGSPMNPGWNWNTYHGGQVDFHNQLVNDPGLYQSILARFTGGSKDTPAASVPTSQMMHATSGHFSPK